MSSFFSLLLKSFLHFVSTFKNFFSAAQLVRQNKLECFGDSLIETKAGAYPSWVPYYA